METQQALMASTEGGGSNKAAAGAAAVCRQSSTRWTPTTDQIRILKELYYNKGVRSPSAEQIQRICLQLKRYGKIEGKNVFYWFQNHKARERQKKRFINSDNVHHPIIQRSSSAQLLINGKPPAAAEDHHQQQYVNMNNKYSNISQGVCSAAAAAASSGGVIGAFNGQTGNYGGYGSINMEKSFRDCSISAGGGTSTTGVGFGSWVGGVDPYGSYSTSAAANFFDMNNIEEHDNFMHQEEEEEEEEEEFHHHHHHQEIETLPLFPMHGEDVFGNKTTTSDHGGVSGGYGYFSGGGGGSGWGGAGFRTSLELSLNSYGYNTPNLY